MFWLTKYLKLIIDFCVCAYRYTWCHLITCWRLFKTDRQEKRFRHYGVFRLHNRFRHNAHMRQRKAPSASKASSARRAPSARKELSASDDEQYFRLRLDEQYFRFGLMNSTFGSAWWTVLSVRLDEQCFSALLWIVFFSFADAPDCKPSALDDVSSDQWMARPAWHASYCHHCTKTFFLPFLGIESALNALAIESIKSFYDWYQKKGWDLNQIIPSSRWPWRLFKEVFKEDWT